MELNRWWLVGGWVVGVVELRQPLPRGCARICHWKKIAQNLVIGMVQKSAGVNQFCQLSMELSKWWLVGGWVVKGGLSPRGVPGSATGRKLHRI